MIDRDSFKPHANLKRERVELPEIGGAVLVRELSAGEALELSKAKEFDPWPVLVKCILNEAGHRIFRDGDEKLLAESITADTMKSLLAVVTRISGLGEASAQGN